MQMDPVDMSSAEPSLPSEPLRGPPPSTQLPHFALPPIGRRTRGFHRGCPPGRSTTLSPWLRSAWARDEAEPALPAEPLGDREEAAAVVPDPGVPLPESSAPQSKEIVPSLPGELSALKGIVTPEFLKQPPGERKRQVQNAGRCFICLQRHRAHQCLSTERCSICRGKHHTLLHSGSCRVPSYSPAAGLAAVGGVPVSRLSKPVPAQAVSSSRVRRPSDLPVGRSNPNRARAKVDNPFEDCLICVGRSGYSGHCTFDCPEWLTLDRGLRWKACVGFGVCPRCLGVHPEPECTYDGSCFVCGGQHLYFIFH